MVLHESIRINYDSDEELEDGVRNSSNSGKEGLMKRESVTALLPDEEDIEGQHQHLEKADPEDEGGKWYSIQAIRHNVKANEGFLLIASSQLFFAIINTLVKLLQQVVDVPTWEIIWIRMSITWLGCFIYMKRAGIPHALLGPPEARVLLCVRGASGFFGLYGIYYSLQYLSLSDATTLSFCAPILCGFLAYLVLSEPYSLSTFFISLTSLFGVVLIAKPSFLFPDEPLNTFIVAGGEVIATGRQRSIAVAVSLVGCCGAAGAYVAIRKIGKTAHALHVIAFFSIFCVLVATIYPFVIHDPPVFPMTLHFAALLLPIGICGFIAQALLTLGLQRETASRGSLAVYSNIIFALALEYSVFGLLPDVWSGLGAVVIIVGGVLVALEKAKG